MDNITLSYLAGALDADGYFTIRRSTYGVRVRHDTDGPTFHERIGLKQVTPMVPHLLKDQFGGYLTQEKPSAKHGQPLWLWQVSDRKAASAAKVLLPYLMVKVRQAGLLLELRAMKEQPRGARKVVQQKNRWGQLKEMTKAVRSREQMLAYEHLYLNIKSMNDTRSAQPMLG